MKKDNARRNFLKVMGVAAVGAPTMMVGAKALEGADRPQRPQLPRDQARAGELFAGFVLLNEHDALPDYVQTASLAETLGCGLATAGARKAETQFESYETQDAFLGALTFPMYSLSHLPGGLEARHFHVRRHLAGRIIHASIGFESFDHDLGQWVTSVSLFGKVAYARPYPLWAAASTEPGEPGVVLEKVSHLPKPGVRVATSSGIVYHWIEEDILYTLDIQISDALSDPEMLVDALVVG
ncbi:hypothetical protein SCOR_29940 [Sulfidibacter corallicola]|uniref:Uncharacterized protein n=1 Tax=Sulfidibacter corallicola TaxID=2818388 RepID=A0A8A4TKW9_SULCO|nr:hypothetical protein [Sulfidibacter corallicola]QTD50223.1 hypothetical protein J3U87_31950 [Sulfidibacter corallicola]